MVSPSYWIAPCSVFTVQATPPVPWHLVADLDLHLRALAAAAVELGQHG